MTGLVESGERTTGSPVSGLAARYRGRTPPTAARAHNEPRNLELGEGQANGASCQSCLSGDQAQRREAPPAVAVHVCTEDERHEPRGGADLALQHESAPPDDRRSRLAAHAAALAWAGRPSGGSGSSASLPGERVRERLDAAGRRRRPRARGRACAVSRTDAGRWRLRMSSAVRRPALVHDVPVHHHVASARPSVGGGVVVLGGMLLRRERVVPLLLSVEPLQVGVRRPVLDPGLPSTT